MAVETGNDLEIGLCNDATYYMHPKKGLDLHLVPNWYYKHLVIKF